jgi:DsbC/DsbD-like thiol-disulfide interchange protein
VPLGLRRSLCWLAAAGPLMAWCPPASSAKPTGGSDHIQVTLVSERAAIRPGEPFEIGLRMKLKEGWHTYWKHAGDAGLPLHVEWMLPPGFTAGPIEWPAPERIQTGGLMSYGYGREVLFSTTITPPAEIAARSVAIAGAFDWLECKDACVAGFAKLTLAIPVRPGPAELGPAAPLFADARARIPRPPNGWNLAATAGNRAIEISFRPPRGVNPRGGYFFIDQPLVVEHAAAQGFERVGDAFRLTMTPAENAVSPPRRITGVLMLDGIPRRTGNALAVDVEAARGDPAPAPAPGKPVWHVVSLYGILFALAGMTVAALLRSRAPRA